MGEVRFKVKFGGRRPVPVAQKPVPGFVNAPEPEAPPVGVQAPSKRQVSRTARLLALAYYVERQIEDGVIADYAEAATLLGMSRARMTQVMDLLLLPLPTQEAILTGRTVASERWLRERRLLSP